MIMQVPESKNAIAHIDQGVLWYSFPALDSFSDRLIHGFSTKIGGVSAGGLSTLNLGIGSGDTRGNVQENYRRFGVACGFDPNEAVFSWQTHDIQLREAKREDAGKGLLYPRDYQGIDGLITKEIKLPLITHYADCTPLFFYAPDKNITAISHAGWRGTAKRMAAVTINELFAQGCNPKEIIAVIGPSAGPEAYEVDGACAAAFMGWRDEDGEITRQIPEKKDKYLLDLWRANRLAMIESGMMAKNISIAGLCTIAHHEIFYSYRILGNERGALAGFVMLK